MKKKTEPDKALAKVKKGELTKKTPTRFNVIKLRTKHLELWEAIEKKVLDDIHRQTDIYNNRKGRLGCDIASVIPSIARNVSYNAAFTAIVEIIKRGGGVYETKNIFLL